MSDTSQQTVSRLAIWIVVLVLAGVAVVGHMWQDTRLQLITQRLDSIDSKLDKIDKALAERK